MSATIAEGPSGRRLHGLGLTAEEEEELFAAREKRAPRNGEICICGHPMTRHREVDLRVSGRGLFWKCTPAKTVCACRHPKAVLEATDTRPFLRRTTGNGPAHALPNGLRGLVDKPGRGYEWLEGWPQCELSGWDEAECEAAETGVLPYGFTDDGRESARTAPWNFMLCRAHAEVASEKGWPT